MPTISEKASKALYGAAIHRGKNKGMLLKNPPRDRLARAAWYGAQMVCNPYKVSISAIMWFDDEEREIYREIEAIMESFKQATKTIPPLDQDRVTLERLGAW